MFDIGGLLQGFSVIGALLLIGTIVFAESGLLIGLFLPGDTLLFTAGFFAAQGHLPILAVMAVVFGAAILGDNLGYFLGQKAGPRIFKRKDGVLFREEYLTRARDFYVRHGGKTVMFARFLPYVRTFAPMIAGAARMRRLKFIFYNIVGALIWTVSFVMIGYFFGVQFAKHVSAVLTPVFIGGLLFAISPTIVYFIKNAQFRRYLKEQLRRVWLWLTRFK